MYICLPLQLAGGDVAGTNNDSGDSVVQEASTSLLLLLHVAAIYRPDEVEDDALISTYILVLLNWFAAPL